MCYMFSMRNLALTLILCACSPLLWQPLRGQAPSVGKESDSKKKNVTADSPGEATADQRGTKESPFVVDTEGHQDTPAETQEKTREKEDKNSVDAWTLRWTGITTGATVVLMLVGIGGVIAAIRTLRAIEKQAGLMEIQIKDARKSSDENADNVRASIAEAVRSASAMEGVAQSMAVNAESVKTSVSISREIADTQKLAIVLQSRAYLSAGINAGKFQDANHVFEVQAYLRNHGNTPAYDVTFKSTAQIIELPISDDFAFPLSDENIGTSVSLMAPGAVKLITQALPAKVPDEQVEDIKRGRPPRRLAMWGIVNYRDAFEQRRQLKFAFLVHWVGWVPGMERDERGNLREEQVMGTDTARHNEAD